METSSGEESTVEWGETANLGNTTSGIFITGSGFSRTYITALSGLTANTKYYYRVITNNTQSDVFDFVTPPLPNSEASFNLISMSDMQRDWEHPNVFEDMINDEIIPFVNNRYGNDLVTDLAYVFIPGDLVVTVAIMVLGKILFLILHNHYFSTYLYIQSQEITNKSPNYLNIFASNKWDKSK